ncbi:MAG: carotenoid oxygenase family protein [Gammaproteobacteria bacterium]|jgi:carotenoid cleavage dioxygenase
MLDNITNNVSDHELQPQDNPILQGNYAPVDSENSFEHLEVVGRIPKDLQGTLLRAGPNPVNPGPNHHWFLGDGMLHAIQLGNGQAKSYRNRWVRTKALDLTGALLRYFAPSRSSLH